MGVGIPGSGKSTFLRENSDMLGGIYLNTDAIRKELSGDEGDQSVHSEAWDLLYTRATDALHEGDSVIIDATNLNPEQRKIDIALYRTHGAQAIIGLCFMIDFDEAWRRVQARDRRVPYSAMRRMHNAFLKHSPTIDEGFDEILSVDTTLPLKRTA